MAGSVGAMTSEITNNSDNISKTKHTSSAPLLPSSLNFILSSRWLNAASAVFIVWTAFIEWAFEWVELCAPAMSPASSPWVTRDSAHRPFRNADEVSIALAWDVHGFRWALVIVHLVRYETGQCRYLKISVHIIRFKPENRVLSNIHITVGPRQRHCNYYVTNGGGVV